MQKVNPGKVMNTTNAKTEDVPSFWEKSRNVIAKLFKREACPCCAEKQPAPKVEEPKEQDKKAAA
jgi:hypothetical protein